MRQKWMFACGILLALVSVGADDLCAQTMALDFDGGDYVLIPAMPELQPGSLMTLEAWVQFDSLPFACDVNSQVGIAGVWNDLVGPQRAFVLWNVECGPEFIVDCCGNAVSLGRAFGGAQQTQTNVPYHYAGVFDGSEVRLYVNGALEAAVPYSGGIFTGSNQPLLIGRTDTGGNGSDFLDGKMSDVRLWNVARSQAEIQAGIAGGVACDSPGLVGFWRLDDGAGLVAVDSTGNGHDGVLGNGNPSSVPSWVTSPFASTPPNCQKFLRADANQDGSLDVSDPIAMLSTLFSGTTTSCDLAMDANDDELLDIADPVYLLAYLFSSGTPIPDPVICGTDPTPGLLTCASFPICP